MATYNKAILTNDGMNLLGDALTGDEIEFVSLVIGSGSYTDEEKSIDYIRNMKALKAEKQSVIFSLIKKVADNQVLLKSNVSNEELAAGYFMTELGVLARKKGTENTILYCVVTTEESDYFPAAEDGKYNIIFNINANIGDVENVSILFSDETYALAEDFQELYLAVEFLCDTTNIESIFYQVFTKAQDNTTMTLSDIENAISTEWNGESSEDETAMSSSDVDNALKTKWNGESSSDETAMSAEDVENATS